MKSPLLFSKEFPITGTMDMFRTPVQRIVIHIVKNFHIYQITNLKRTTWPESASELYGPSDRRLSAKLVPTFADRGCHVTDSCGRILGFLDRSHYFYFQVAPQLHSRG
jgi:hypothetical protein